MDKVYDTIIIGSGFAGLFAAVAAIKKSKSVMVLEKMSHFGGNSIKCAGQLAVPCSLEQQLLCIEDSPEQMVKDILNSGRGLNNILLVNRFIKEIPEVIKFIKNLGIKFKNNVYQFSGHSVPRVLLTENESGADIYLPVFEYAKSKGVMFRSNTLVERILINENDQITGLRVRENYVFGDKYSGIVSNYQYKDRLIVASGGWGADKDFISLQNPSYANLDTTSHYGATGECLKLLLNINAVPILLDSYQLGPWASPDEIGAAHGANFADYALLGGLMVNIGTGCRFVNEMGDRKEIADAQLKCRDENGHPQYPLLICNKDVALRSSVLDKALETGVLKRFETYEHLMDEYDFSEDCRANFQQQITNWNNYIVSGSDPEFGKDMKYSCPIEDEVYAMRLWPKIHYCQGGVAITENAGVIDIETLSAIPNIFACGEIGGGLHGESRLAAVSALEAMVFGSIAGR